MHILKRLLRPQGHHPCTHNRSFMHNPVQLVRCDARPHSGSRQVQHLAPCPARSTYPLQLLAAADDCLVAAQGVQTEVMTVSIACRLVYGVAQGAE